MERGPEVQAGVPLKQGAAVIVYDGECPVCRKAVDRVRSRAEPGAFEFLSCHSGDLPLRFPSIERSACLQAMHLVLPDGTILSGADALPEIFTRLRRCGWFARLLGLPGARPLSRLLYRGFAGRRHRIGRWLFPGSKRS